VQQEHRRQRQSAYELAEGLRGVASEQSPWAQRRVLFSDNLKPHTPGCL
jgi:hypothetical protein